MFFEITHEVHFYIIISNNYVILNFLFVCLFKLFNVGVIIYKVYKT